MGKRSGLVVLLLMALVVVLGGSEAGVGARTGGGFPLPNVAFTDWVRGLVGGGQRSTPHDKVAANAVLPREQDAPTGKPWPAQKRVRELVERRTSTARFFQLSDGRVQAEISSTPVNYRDGNGFRPIDTRVGKVSRPGFAVGNTTNSFTSLFGDKSDRLVRFEMQGRNVELGLSGTPKGVAPQVAGSTVTYPGLAGGADLVYEVTPIALKEKIVLRAAPAGGVSYEFTLRTGGLSAQQRADGSIAFVAPSGGAAVFTMPAPFMYDSGADPTSPVGKGFSAKVTQRVTQSGGTSTITVTADRAWLTDSARKYPVVMDPTIKIEPVPSDAQDVQIYSGDTARNYNDTYQLKVGTDATQAYRTLVKFPLTGVPAGTALDSAQLQMYYSQTHTAWEYDVSMEARRVTAPWTESTATWASMNANIAPSAAGNTELVDDGDAGKTSVVGTWPYSTNATLTPKAINADYRYNNDATTGHSHTWVPTIPESGDYQVEVHYTAESDRATNAPYTVYFNGGQKTYLVDQTGAPDGVWKTLGVHPFLAGTSHKVVLGDVANKSVIADAVRFTKSAVDTKKRGVSSVWNTFSVRTMVQSWIDGTQPNYGFMVKAVDESPKGRGGPIYEASEYAYMNNGRVDNLPKLVLTWGRPGVSLAAPTTITATGAQLDWSAYTDPSTAPGDNLVEYQVHRSVYQHFTPSAATLVAPLPAGTTSFLDTTATPTPADQGDPLQGNYYFYMVAVKTADGQVIPAPTQGVRLPKAGRIVKVFRGAVDTNLSAARPESNVDVYDGDPYVSAGNNSTYYGDTRGLVKFPTLSGIPAGAVVTDAQLQMWTAYNYGATNGTVDVHKLTRDFDETTATWNRASATTPWTTPGGDYLATPESTFNGFTNDPEWESWTTTQTVKDWLANPSSNYGFLLKMHDESVSTQRVMMLSDEGAEPLLRPTLLVSYLEKTPESTYYAPATEPQMTAGDQYTVPVTVSNTTAATKNSADWVLSYRWSLPDGTDVTNGANQLQTALPRNLVVGDTVTINAQVKTPVQSSDGNKRIDHVLKWELYNKTTGQWLSTTDSIASLNQNVAVEDPTSDQLGLERFYSYTGRDTGAGSSLLNNLYSGNTVWSYSAFSNPSRGLDTFAGLAYNSKDTSDTVAGYGWSLQAASVMRLGAPLDFHPNPNPTKVTLTDGDGTSHFFSWDATAGQWRSPKGVHLYLQRLVVCDNKTEESRAWVLTKPDRTQFFYDCDGYLSTVSDNNGNEMRFTYEVRRSQNKPTKFLRYLTDPSGRQTLTIDYYAKGDSYSYIDDVTWTKQSATNLTNPHIIDHVKQVTDVSGRRLTFTYTDKGLLGELVDGAGSAQPKVFAFAYDMTQGNKNVKLVKVTDPRGNATNLDYYSPPQDDPKFHWATKTYTDRLGNPTRFAYTDPDGTAGSNIQTVVTDAENHNTTDLMDGFGRPIQTTNAKNETTKLGWDTDHNAIRLEEANGAVSSWTYDPKTGYPTELKDAEANRNGTAGTVLTYQTQLNGYVADLATKTSPEGRKWTFGHTLEGDLASVTDPLGNTTTDPNDYTTSYTYDTYGQLLTAKDANGHTTTYGNYDPNGYPQTVTDPLNHATAYVYDVRGQVTKVTDALGHDTTQTYDTFGRPLVNVTPKDQAAGVLITTPAPVYDANDNITTATAANGAVFTASYDADDRMTFALEPVDNPGDPQRKTSFTYDKVGDPLTTTEPDGNLTTDPTDFVTTLGYDEIYQKTSMIDAAGHRTTYSYDNAGNLTKVVDPRKNATVDPADFTGTYAYDLAHRMVKVTDASGHFTTTTYDHDGLVTARTDEDGNTTTYTLDSRGDVSKMAVPHVNNGGTVSYNTTQFGYDQVGNRTSVVSPRGFATTGVANDFVSETTYDELNRVASRRTPFDPNDARYNTPDVTTYSYDPVGRLAKVSAPPSNGQSVRNDTTFTYFDNGWTRTSVDPWDIITGYDYDALGKQTTRTLSSAGGSSSRTMSWTYHPDSKLRSRSDDGVPVGLQVALVDNSDSQSTATTGSWPTSQTGTGFQGYNYATHPAGTGSNSFTWNAVIPQDGDYTVYVRYPAVSGAASNASYTVNFTGGSASRTVDQTANTGGWVSLGKYAFTANGAGQKVTLSDNANGTVVADAVKLVRDNSADTDNEKKAFTYTYDSNGNLVTIGDSSPGADVDTDVVTYDGLNQVSKVEEKAGSVVRHTTGFSYDENGNVATGTHDGAIDTYEYDVRDQLAKATNAVSASDPSPKVSTFTYTSRGQTLRQTKPNGNTVDFTYYLDRLLHSQVEKKSDGTLVSSHTLDYDANSNRSRDASKVQNADNHAAYLDQVYTYGYDPRDRVAQVTKTPTGGTASTETYVHDANDNVISQTVKGTSSTFTYDRDRLVSAQTQGITSTYNYDPFGRLDTVFTAGSLTARYSYDGFDRVAALTAPNSGGATTTTRYTYDALDRTRSRTDNAGGASEKTTQFGYLGLTDTLLTEQVGGQVTRTYQYALGQRLTQATRGSDGTTSYAYYGYTPHTDVETLTDATGDTKATYGYSAYGALDQQQSTGLDKPDPANPGKDPYNQFRFNGKWQDAASGDYDMGYRDYSPTLNRFLTRDMYEGALSDLALATDPFTGNRYAFGGGNPIGAVEIDGHCWDWLCDTVGGWLNGAVHATWDPVRDWVATSVGGMAAAGCPAQVGAQGGCTGVQDTVTNDIKQKTDFNVPIGNPNSTTYKVADVVGQITGIPIPGGAAAAADRLATRVAARFALRAATRDATKLTPNLVSATTARLQTHVAQAVSDFGSGVIRMSTRQARRAARNPRLAPAFRGQVIDAAVKNAVRNDPNLSHLWVSRSGEFGPDFHDIGTNTWWDVTTRPQWFDHVRRYAYPFGTGIGLFI